MAVGKEIVAAFAGAADYLSFDLTTHKSSTETIRVELTEAERTLNEMYAKVRALRAESNSEERHPKSDNLIQIFDTVRNDHPKDWLLPLEIYELTLSEVVLSHLEQLKKEKPEVAHLIDSGIALIG